MQFYKEDREINRDCNYLNGEREVYNDSSNLDDFKQKPLPVSASFIFKEHWADADFDTKEIMDVFKEIAKDGDSNQPIEIIVKVGFMYNDMSYRVKGSKREIPLHKVKTKMAELEDRYKTK